MATDLTHADSPSDEPDLDTIVRSLFAEVLEVEGVETDDDFFELGGHSLTAIMLASRLSEAIGTRVSVREVFDAPTAAELSARLRTRDL